MYNNIQGRVISKELQILDHFETTYNFEVEDNHNYYVGEECILVHNECSRVDEFLNFKSEEDLFEHFTKHADEFDDLYKTVDAYLEGANYVIKNGIYVPEMNGYIKFFGSGTRTSKFAFVGLTRDKSYIVTLGIRSTQELSRKTALIVI